MLDINHQGRLRGNPLTGPRQTRRARAQRREPSLARLGWTGAFAKDARGGLGEHATVLCETLKCKDHQNGSQRLATGFKPVRPQQKDGHMLSIYLDATLIIAYGFADKFAISWLN